jgi:hypothetical protein
MPALLTNQEVEVQDAALSGAARAALNQLFIKDYGGKTALEEAEDDGGECPECPDCDCPDCPDCPDCR